MSTLSPNEAAQLRAHLQNAVVACTDRCLYQSAKWAAELLNSLPPTDMAYGSDTDPDSPMADSPPSALKSQITPGDALEAQLEAKELPKYLLAKTYFDCREFDRCANVFLPGIMPKVSLSSASPSIGKGKMPKGKTKLSTPTNSQENRDNYSGLSQKALFLALYAKYISGEKRKDEESEMILGPVDGGATPNRELNNIANILEDWFKDREAKGGTSQGWLEYLYGIVLAKGKNEEQAKAWLIRSVRIYPYNWGAWQELASLLGTSEELGTILKQLLPNIMTYIFHIHTSQELYQTDQGIHSSLNQILSIFPTSAFLLTQRALLLYHSKDFDEAESIFSQLLQSDPYRLDSLDHYSNVLYVMELDPKLAFLAQLCTRTDKFRPETCCVVGNYYSRKSEHEKAVVYFRRALTLDRSFLSAWTLMGHEYIEMKNTHAAIESYRRAVDVNRKDYRAWYGLGQTYEVLEMHSYALFYYQRAAALRPFDAKMWMAVGQCFGKTGRCDNGIRAYKRALVVGSYYEGSANNSFGSQEGLTGGVLDPEVLYQIALLYERQNRLEECAEYMELTLAQEEGPEPSEDLSEYGASAREGAPMGVGVTPTTSKARMWLAKWEFMRQNYQRAMELANELCQDGVEVEEAKALVRDVRARIEKGKEGG